MTYELQPDDNPDHGEDCATDPCHECEAIAGDWMDEVLADQVRDGWEA